MNIFSYESKFSQTLMFVADLCILNLLYVLCCIPVFTIGAAQAALYSGIRTLQDPEDDESPAKAFLRAFRTGFGSITLGWGFYFVLTLLMGVVFYFVVLFGQTIAGAPVWMCIIALVFLLVLQTQVPLFHARFSCTPKQLIRNGWMMMFFHPLRSLLTTVLLWAPAVLFFKDMFMMVMTSPVWLLLYYSIVHLLSFNIMKKPFKVLIDHYNETHDENGNVITPTEESAESEEAEEEVEEIEETPVS